MLCFRRMQQLLEYASHHPYLVAGAVVAAVIVLLNELRARVQAFAALSSMQAVRLMNQGALVIDLRAKDSFDAGHIADARNVPAATLQSEADALMKKWRDKTVITYSEDGRDGATAARTLVKLGFTQVFNLDGGLNAWLKDNLPLAKSTAANKQLGK
jgi:rhodanese-related sulfurtransferase